MSEEVKGKEVDPKTLEEKVEAKPKKGMCKCPIGSPAKGDKDPLVLAWHKKYRKDLYVSKGMEAFVKKHKIKLP